MELDKKILSDITVFGKYAKYIPHLQRRETWDEICDRYQTMMITKYPNLEEEIKLNMFFVRNKKVLPSMRALQFAGRPVELNNSRIFNCAFLPVDHYKSFSETMFLLLGGTGVGYSVQYSHIDKLPEIQKPTKTKRYLIADSIEGWADSIKILMKAYFGLSNAKPLFDYRDIRPKGARLITAGGKAPGYEPLKICLEKIESLLETKNNGEKLSSVECHDIQCHIANAVLAGGIRRAALISLFSFDDDAMLQSKSNFKITDWKFKQIEYREPNTEQLQLIDSVHVDDKTGEKYYDLEVTVDEPYYGIKNTTAWWVREEDLNKLKNEGTLAWYYFQEQRGRANNSAVAIRSRIKKKEFFKLWKKIQNSGAGEPGISWSNNNDWGFNPCHEISLRSYQFCNLCEVNVSELESQEDLNKRVEVAAFFGTLQAGFTDFHYLRDIWKKTTEKDALIGVGMTGIGSGAVLKYDIVLAARICTNINEIIANIIGINKAARCTTIKPAGTTSLVLGTASGIHAWHNDYYIRRMRLGKNEALYTYLSIYNPDLLEDDHFLPQLQAVVKIPVKAPENSILRNEDVSDLLERVKDFNLKWVREGHRIGDNYNNVSATISIKDNEWDEVGEWMWNNRDVYSGISVLPYDNGTYIQAPFTDCTKEEYYDLVSKLNDIDVTNIIEVDDITDLKGELACFAGGCEIK